MDRTLYDIFNLELPMGHVDARAVRVAINSLRDTVVRLEQSLASIEPAQREALIKTLVAYDERIDELERAYSPRA